MAVNAINGSAFSSLSAIDGIARSTLSAVNGQALGASAFDPTVVSDCTLWLSANNLSLSDNDPVGTWANAGSAGGSFTNTGTARPTYKTNQKNGFPAVYFDGSNDRITGALAVSNYITASAFTIFAVIRPISTNGNGANNYDAAAVFTDTGGFCGITVKSTNLLLYQDAPNGTATRSFTLGDWYILEGYKDPDLHLSLNAGTEATAVVGNVGSLSNVGRMGVKYNDTLWFLEAYYGELVIYNRTLNSTERATVRNGFNSMYAVF